MKVLIIGSTGMLGNAAIRLLSENSDWQVFGTARSDSARRLFRPDIASRMIFGLDVENYDSLTKTISQIRPNVVVNCVGLVKQLASAEEPLQAIPVNALLPHRMAQLCELVGSRLVHISTDCVFSGAKGMYTEADSPDAKDLYGRSKFLGEVDYPHAVTLRTSIIGHELDGARSLIGWFLSQTGCVKGYKRAIFSGLPTVEIARVLRDHVIPYPELHGVYHVSAEPISKFDLLSLVAQTYEKIIDITADDQTVIDRSLDSTRFRQATGFAPKPWPELIRSMRAFG
jgi:dTDP-4-dehydrorhamnose reductase